MNLSITLAPAAAVITLACCQSSVLTGPPSLKLGRDQCAECGMLVSDQRCAASLLVDSDGRREHLIYDDIGCMLDAEQKAASNIVERHVRDYANDGWVVAQQAAFLLADPSTLPTPMGSGIVAFAVPASAEAEARKRGGVVVDFAALASTRVRARIPGAATDAAAHHSPAR